MINEVEPPKPSTRLSTLAADTQTATASECHSDPKRLTQQLRGDLDWIVMRCWKKTAPAAMKPPLAWRKT